MPVVLEAILVSLGMLLIFGLAFFALFLVAIAMAPVERGLSKIIWDATTPKRPLPSQPKSTFRDFSSRH